MPLMDVRNVDSRDVLHVSLGENDRLESVMLPRYLNDLIRVSAISFKKTITYFAQDKVI